MPIKMKATCFPFGETRTTGVPGYMELNQFHAARETKLILTPRGTQVNYIRPTRVDLYVNWGLFCVSAFTSQRRVCQDTLNQNLRFLISTSKGYSQGTLEVLTAVTMDYCLPENDIS
jgi:hypothetical protein